MFWCSVLHHCDLLSCPSGEWGLSIDRGMGRAKSCLDFLTVLLDSICLGETSASLRKLWFPMPWLVFWTVRQTGGQPPAPSLQLVKGDARNTNSAVWVTAVSSSEQTAEVCCVSEPGLSYWLYLWADTRGSEPHGSFRKDSSWLNAPWQTPWGLGGWLSSFKLQGGTAPRNVFVLRSCYALAYPCQL